MDEPVLTDQDRKIWEAWRRECLMWTRTSTHKRRVQAARDDVRRMMDICPDAYVAWSAGKDSTAMAALCAEEGIRGRYMSIKDDLDFPGEVEYLKSVAGQLEIADKLDVVWPPISLQKWLEEHDVRSGEDLHSRQHKFSQDCFYSVIDDYRSAAGIPGVYLGLRTRESKGRRMNRWCRGKIYRKLDTETVCQPIADWAMQDVYGFMFERDIEFLHVYRCVRFARKPGVVRKSWWVPGHGVKDGETAWLRHYYPSLYQRLLELFPDAQEWS